ncbi:PelD GGDEF domain-containing protein [Halopseudomonas maritima]|uniref:PelD GGDEF domain-containing protein n=1 Tax=Halopseudomonas maritima TaxID=2918528 RepID=UPI001EE9D2F0|nr:PelD GGDEF domain-containing protein [Halopseudomonas maritima]UJJ30585.1 GAF domain-containing protein [Halopseudomonas maritima]
MFKNSVHKDYRLAPGNNRRWSWVETPLLTALVLGVCYWLHPADPLFLHGFPWPILAPLLLAVRYGFLQGACSAALLVLVAYVLHRLGLAGYVELPGSFIVGVLVSSMVVGEFRDLWGRRLERLQTANEYRQYRLDEFTRAYHVLRSSHERLEQRVAGSDTSLRSTLLLLRRQLQEQPQGDALEQMAPALLGVLAQYGSFNAAALYAVREGELLLQRPLAEIGEAVELSADDLLLTLCLQRGDVVSVRDSFLETGREEQVSALQACIPLLSVEGEVLAVVAVHSMPFFAFNERTFTLLALLGGHMADLLETPRQLLRPDDAEARRFSVQLRRALRDANEHDLPSSLMFLKLPDDSVALQKLLIESQRGLDLQLVLSSANGGEGVLVLMPLTDQDGSLGYSQRLNLMVQERFDNASSLQALGVGIHYYEIRQNQPDSALAEFLYQECGLNDQQVAI